MKKFYLNYLSSQDNNITNSIMHMKDINLFMPKEYFKILYLNAIEIQF